MSYDANAMRHGTSNPMAAPNSRAERVWICPRCGNVQHEPPDDRAWAHYGLSTGIRTCGFRGEWRTFISSTDHESEIERFAARFEERADECEGLENPKSADAAVAAFHECASLLRDRVGQGEDG